VLVRNPVVCIAVCLCLALVAHAADEQVKEPYFGIHVVDDRSGRGVPLVELQTVNNIVHITDSAGWAAFHEPGLMDREVFFSLAAPGYEYPKDGFGYRGCRLRTKPGTSATVKIKRTNIAERIYRVTGQGIYRDSTLLGLPAPIPESNDNPGVLGQDSVQAMPYKGKIFWLWGDTNVAHYPLGNFQTTSATSPLPGESGVKPSDGIALTYFTDQPKGNIRHMVPLKERGPVWLFGLLTVKDPEGRDALMAHFTRQKDLGTVLEHGIVRFDDQEGIFKRVATFDLKKTTWQFPNHNAVRIQDAAGDYYYFAHPFLYSRVRATYEAILDPDRYEAFAYDALSKKYRWQRADKPTRQTDEQRLLKEGKLAAALARYQLVDATTGTPVLIHGASINWNDYRKKWIMIGLQPGDANAPSLLGELWYAEAVTPLGPWTKAVKIITHPKYSFYNPRHHVFLDEQGGRIIYFEGTYSHTFSGSAVQTPRYDYNQVMYRLDLGDRGLEVAR
jgi:hypothetical protein